MSLSARVREHLRTNIVGYIALFSFGMGGTAFAVEANSVTSKHIKNGQVKTADLAGGAVTAARIGANQVTGAQIDESTLGEVPSAFEAASATSATTAENANKLDDLDSTDLQRRVTTNCGPSQAIGSVNADGTANCVAGASGDITGVNAGQGLTGGGPAGDVTLHVNPSQVQTRVGGQCTAGSSVRAVNQDGSVACETDDAGGPPSGSAGGDLSGIYPNPSLAAGAVQASEINDGATLSEIADDDGAGSGLDADLLDGISSNGFLQTSATAGGDLSGPFSNLQIANGTVGAGEINPSQVQARVAGTCPAGQAAQSVTQAGNLACGATNGGAPGGPAGGDLLGFYPAPAIAANAVGTSEVTDNSLRAQDLADEPAAKGSGPGSGTVPLSIGPLTSLTITAPANGFLVLHGQATFNATSTGNAVEWWVREGTTQLMTGSWDAGDVDGWMDNMQSFQGIIPVSAGAHTYSLQAQHSGPGTPPTYFDARLVAMFFPSTL